MNHYLLLLNRVANETLLAARHWKIWSLPEIAMNRLVAVELCGGGIENKTTERGRGA